jgi:hypothetical protein
VSKQTLITPAMQINTGRAPSAANGAPPIGQAVRVDVYFDAATPDVDISMTAIMQNGCFSTVQCIFVDNSLNPATVIIIIPGIQQRIIVNGFSQSLEPIYVSDSAASAPIRVHSENANAIGFPVSIWFSNVPQPFYSKNGLLNSTKNIILTLPIGNVDALHHYSYSVDLTSSMLQYSVPDWRTILIDNSAGFQHIFVNDVTVGAVVGIINPYTIAQIPTLGLGSALYSFTAYDMANNAAQNNVVYGYDVSVIIRSFDAATYFNSIGDIAQYKITTTVALAAGNSFFLYPLYMRKRVTFFAPAIFIGRHNGFSQNAVADARGSFVLTYDFTSVSGTQGILGGNNLDIFSASAQNISIRDIF